MTEFYFPSVDEKVIQVTKKRVIDTIFYYDFRFLKFGFIENRKMNYNAKKMSEVQKEGDCENYYACKLLLINLFTK